MSARRLNDTEKKKIVGLYRESGETAMSLAEQFGVSNTTISRILKAGIESDEYDRLIQQKRRGIEHPPLEIAIPVLEAESPRPITPTTPLKTIDVSPINSPINLKPNNREPNLTPPIGEQISLQSHSVDPNSGRRLRRRRTTTEPSSTTTAPGHLVPQSLSAASNPSSSYHASVQAQLPFPDSNAESQFIPQLQQTSDEDLAPSASNKPARKIIQVGLSKRSEMLEELEELDNDLNNDLNDDEILPPVTEEIAAILEEDFNEDDDPDEDQDDDPDEEEDDEQDDEQPDIPPLQVEQFMQVLPLHQASMPRVCYLVVDRSAELVLRPLKDFGEIGQVPPGRDQVLTLPIFDNPRVAKRFSNARTERVIKIPDSQVFHKTADKLRGKGITYLFIDGQLYSL